MSLLLLSCTFVMLILLFLLLALYEEQFDLAGFNLM